MIHIISWRLLNKYTSVKFFTFRKMSLKLYSFRVPVYKGVPLPWRKLHPSYFRVPVFKGVPLPWMKWNPAFNDYWWPTIRVWKVSLSEKWVLNYTTSGFPFLMGFPSPEFDDTHPLTITGGQLYECENFRFLKSECYTIQLQGSPL